MKKGISYIITIIISITIGICGTIIVLNKFPLKEKQVESVVKDVTINETNTIKESIDQIYDAVVLIETFKNGQGYATGTGFIYKIDDKKAYIMTNYHVIENADKIEVTNIAQKTVEATLLGGDNYADIAVLSIEKEAALKEAKIGSSTEMNLGDSVFTVGSPLGKKYVGTVTKGIISGTNRLVTVKMSDSSSYMMQVLQTDAAINSGNSGGPLVNMKGEVIGVNSMKLVDEKVEGMGFSIPIEIAMASVEKLENGEEITRPVVGVELIDASNTYALYYSGITIDNDIDKGTVVTKVYDEYPAKKAGLKKGDVITAINGENIENSAHFRYLLYKYQIGDTIELTIYRDKKIIKVNVTL